MKKFLKRLRYFLFLRTRNKIEMIPWKLLDLHLTTHTGLRLFIKNRSDWDIYNEIFVRGDYDFAINTAIEKRIKGSDFNFIDLGANVGFFTLRVFDRVFNSNTSLNVSGIALEGSLKVYHNMEQRFSQNSLKYDIKLIHGLAGRKDGYAKIYESGNSLTNSVIITSKVRKALSGSEVPYIDISQFFDDSMYVDLLKCDIEGSEEEFMINYPDILKRTQVLVIELHHNKCNTGMCKGLIKESGLKNTKTIFDYGNDVSLKVYWRD